MKVRYRALSQLGAALALCLVAGGCTQPGPQEPTVAPTPASTSPTETQLERETRLDFEAAEKAYRAFRAEYARIAIAGGASRATKAMTDNAAGPYLKVMTGFLAQTKADGKRQQGNLRIAYVKHGVYSPSQLNLEVCEDGTKVRNITKSGKVSWGVAAKIVLYMRPIDGRWKVWNGDDEVVSSCGS